MPGSTTTGGNVSGRANQHNDWIPRDFWLTDEEKKAILDFQQRYPQERYRRLTYMMIDSDVVAASSFTVFRGLRGAAQLQPWSKIDQEGQRLRVAVGAA